MLVFGGGVFQNSSFSDKPRPNNISGIVSGALNQKNTGKTLKDLFRKFSHRISITVGSPVAFILAVAVIVVWVLSGPFFGFSDTWQLVINTGTTIITFLMVFLIQNTQNRDARVMQLKLDELIRTISGARNSLVDLEDLSDEEVARVSREFQKFQTGEGSGKLHEVIT